MERVDDIVADSQPIMIKIDVEGAELEVLSGAQRLLANPSLKVIELETVVPESAAILMQNGFEKACYDPFRRTLDKSAGPCRSSNSLFVRDWAFVADRLQTARPIEILGRQI